MIRLGLIGWPVSHSLSPKLHNSALKAIGLDGDYQLFPINPQEEDRFSQMINLVRTGDITGINITIPYKKTVIGYMDELTPMAKLVGAVNTIYLRDGKLIGHNTDVPGFLIDLENKAPALNKFPGSAIVLGAGGSARAVVVALTGYKWQVTLAVRNLDQARELSEYINQTMNQELVQIRSLSSESLGAIIQNTNLIVNATPLGMFPNIDSTPWPKSLYWPTNALVYDLIYNPPETRFMHQAKSEGLIVVNGLGMLVEQAALAFEIWTGVAAPRDVMYSAVNSERN